MQRRGTSLVAAVSAAAVWAPSPSLARRRYKRSIPHYWTRVNNRRKNGDSSGADATATATATAAQPIYGGRWGSRTATAWTEQQLS